MQNKWLIFIMQSGFDCSPSYYECSLQFLTDFMPFFIFQRIRPFIIIKTKSFLLPHLIVKCPLFMPMKDDLTHHILIPNFTFSKVETAKPMQKHLCAHAIWTETSAPEVKFKKSSLQVKSKEFFCIFLWIPSKVKLTGRFFDKVQEWK